jgi:hypothetical protein
MIAWFSRADWLDRRWLLAVGLLSALACLGWWAADVREHTLVGVTDGRGEHLGRDFINYWSGAELAVQGRPEFAYDIDGFLQFQRGHTAPNAEFKWYGYPPTLMLLTLPLAALPFAPALFAWLGAGAAACAALLSRLTGWRLAVLAMLGAPAAYLNVIAGQNGQYTALLFAGGLMALERRPVLAGVCFGLLSYKPHLGVLIPFALAAAGRWRAFLAAGATVVGLVGLSLLAFGSEPWAAFIENAPFHREIMETNQTLWKRMPSVFAAARVSELSPSIGYLLQGVSALLALAATVWVWRRSASLELKSAVLVTATFLATPYSWDYDLIVLVFVAAWVAVEAVRTGFLPWEKLALSIAVIGPGFTYRLAYFHKISLEPLFLWIVLLLLLRRAAVTGGALSPNAASA